MTQVSTHLQDFSAEFLELGPNGRPNALVWRYDHPVSARVDGADVVFELAFKALDSRFDEVKLPPRTFGMRLRAYGLEVLRVTVEPGEAPAAPQESPMLDLHESVAPEGLCLHEDEEEWIVVGVDGRPRARLAKTPIPIKGGNQRGYTISAPIRFLADGKRPVCAVGTDYFAKRPESLPIAFREVDGAYDKAFFGLHAGASERFAGTGERFRRMDLAGGTYVLENTDALGCNNRRAYKNVPFYLSSRPYGLFLHTSAHLRLSLADLSTRAAQAAIDEPRIDAFFIGGGTWEEILFNYRCLTGFPPMVPQWTFGAWMSRCSYHSAAEVDTVARTLREEQLPCDVLHVDTGWFKYEWVCDWKFSEERFPAAAQWLATLREQGFRVSLWQTPYIGSFSPIANEAQSRGFLSRNKKGTAQGTTESHFSPDTSLAYIDFTNPDAVRWYQEELLRPLLEMGVAAIKTDFGEDIDLDAEYAGMDAGHLHNIYCLLYQRAAAEVTEQVHGARMVFGRSCWAGSQRYPLHWGGDTAGTWDGMAGVLRGGLHFGLSGFAFWSHDVGGFYGLPDFMDSLPDTRLYIRWSQFGVLSSHLRFHGTTAREPYAFPEALPIVRKWLRLRYALIPYLMEQARQACQSGAPMLAPLVLRHMDDPAAWHVDDQYYLGMDLLVAPIMEAEGCRDVYLPEGRWVDFWTGQRFDGPVRLARQSHSLETIPLFVRAGAELPVYPHPVQSTNEMDAGKTALLRFGNDYRGFGSTQLGKSCGFGEC